MPYNRIEHLRVESRVPGGGGSIAAFIDPDKTFKREGIEAVKAFKRAKPWRGSSAERAVKFGNLHTVLCGVYDVEYQLNMHIDDPEQAEGGLSIDHEEKKIHLVGKFSVTNYLIAFAGARGLSEGKSIAWGVNMFAKCFPVLFAELDTSGPVLKKRERPRSNPENN